MGKAVKGVLGGVTSLFSAPKAPSIKEPAVMPTPDDDAVRAAARRKMAATQSRSGRVSTILSGDDDKLGG
jgi:hypothetical protein